MFIADGDAQFGGNYAAGQRTQQRFGALFLTAQQLQKTGSDIETIVIAIPAILDEDMRRKAQLLLGRKYGVRVLRMGLIELTTARAYRLIAGGSSDSPLSMVPLV